MSKHTRHRQSSSIWPQGIRTREQKAAFLDDFLSTSTTFARHYFTRPVHEYLQLPDGNWFHTEVMLWRVAAGYAHVVTFDPLTFKPGRWEYPAQLTAWYIEQAIFKRDIEGHYLDENAFKQLLIKAVPILVAQEEARS